MCSFCINVTYLSKPKDQYCHFIFLRFIAFGRGKHIPLTPDNQNPDFPTEISNTGRVVVKKCIDKIDKRETLLQHQQQQQQQLLLLQHQQREREQKERQFYRRANTIDRNGKIIERKTKGRLYSVGGNEPLIRKGYRGRLDRLKTVGTFDLDTEISVLSEVARNLNETLITSDPTTGTGYSSPSAGSSTTTTTYKYATSATPTTTLSMQSTSVRNTPESYKRQLNKSISSIRTTSDASGRAVTFRRGPPGTGKVVIRRGDGSESGAIVQTQHSADDCIQRKFYFGVERKSRSLSTSGFLNRVETQHVQFQQQQLLDERVKRQRQQSPVAKRTPGRASSEDGAVTSSNAQATAATKSVEFSKSTAEATSVDDIVDSKKEFSYMKRRSMLRKSKRIVRTDSEIFREGIVESSATTTGDEEKSEKNIIVLQDSDIQIHLKSSDDGRDTDEDQQQRQQQTLKHPPSSLLQTRTKMSSSQDYNDRNSSVTSSSVFSRKNSSDFDDLFSPKDYQYRQSTTTTATTTDSSKNQSAEELDAVFSDSTQDLEALEKEYKELMKSNLQREYKSDGDTLDEIGKKRRDDFSKWKNQSLEHDFGIVTIAESSTKEEPVISPTAATSTPTTTTAATSFKLTDELYSLRTYDMASSDLLVTKDLSRICSPESCATSAYSDSGVVKGFDIPSRGIVGDPSIGGVGGASNLRLRVYSSSRVGETPTERERLSYYPSHHPHHSSTDDDYDIEMMTPSKIRQYQHSHSISMSSDGDAGDELLRLQKATYRPSILKVDRKSTAITQQQQQQQQESIDTVTSSEQEPSVVKCSSIFDNPLSKFKKVNKLLKCKRFSASVLYDKKSVPETVSTDAGVMTITTTATSGTVSVSSTSTAPSATVSTSNIPAATFATTSSAKKSDSPSMKPLKKKRAIHLSKLSLFSQKHRKQSTASASISHSSHELTSKSITTKQSKLSSLETSKSTCEISKTKLSPLRFSRRSSKRDKSKTASLSEQQQQPTVCQSPLSEEFYNKTGSVRLSAIELYEKFCSEDFGGLYKHEDDQRLPYSYNGNNQHEYRLEKKGLRTIGRYHKNAKLLKQKSEPKFHYLSSSSRTAADTFYHEEEEYYYDSHPEDEYYYSKGTGRHYGGSYIGPYYNEQDEYYDEYEDDVEGFEGDYYEDVDHDVYDDADEEHMHDNRPKTALGAFDVGGLEFRKVDEDIDREENDDEDDDREIIATVGIGTASLPSTGGGGFIGGRNIIDKQPLEGGEMNFGTDSDVDEILLMPSEGSKCSGSDYEEYGFENKQFTLEQKILKSFDDKDVKSKSRIRDDNHFGYGRSGGDSCSSSSKDIADEVLTIYKICSREYLDKNFGAFKQISYSSSDSLHRQKYEKDDDDTDAKRIKKLKRDGKKEKQAQYDDDGKYINAEDDISDDKENIEEQDIDDLSNSKKYRSLSLQCGESLQKVVSEYVKLSTTGSDQHIPPISTSQSKLLASPMMIRTKDERISSLSTGKISSVGEGGMGGPAIESSTIVSKTTTTTIKTDLDISEKTDSGNNGGGSLELLSTQTNSSSGGTIRSHSTLTEYAFDTVKNLNMDSCSTNSKLSLSLKSEIFDDFTITPDDLKKPITNKCDIEDFTLTPDGSLSDENKCISTTTQQQQASLHFKFDETISKDDDKKEQEKGKGGADDDKDEIDENKPSSPVLLSSSPPPPPSLTYDDDNNNANNGKIGDNVLLIVNEFLANERNLPKATDFFDSSSSDGRIDDKILKTDKNPTQNIVEEETEKTKDSSSSNIDDYDDEKIIAAAAAIGIIKQSLQQKQRKIDDSESTDEFTSIDLYNTTTSGSFNQNTSSSSTTTKCTTDDTDDNYNEYDDEQISLFTSELTKEFDKLFSKAEQYINERQIKDDVNTVSDKTDDGNQEKPDDEDDNKEENDDRKYFKKCNVDKLSQKTTITSSTVAVATAIVKGVTETTLTSSTITPISIPIEAGTAAAEIVASIATAIVTDTTSKSDDGLDTSDDDCSTITKVRTVADIPSRYSMQKLEPLDFFDYHYDGDDDDGNRSKKYKKEIIIKTKSPCTHTISSSSSTTTTTITSKITPSQSHSQRSHKKNKKLQKQNRSQSLGNLNKKTKCFPL